MTGYVRDVTRYMKSHHDRCDWDMKGCDRAQEEVCRARRGATRGEHISHHVTPVKACVGTSEWRRPEIGVGNDSSTCTRFVCVRTLGLALWEPICMHTVTHTAHVRFKRRRDTMPWEFRRVCSFCMSSSTPTLTRYDMGNRTDK